MADRAAQAYVTNPRHRQNRCLYLCIQARIFLEKSNAGHFVLYSTDFLGFLAHDHYKPQL